MNVFRYIQFIKIEKQTQIPMISILYAKKLFSTPIPDIYVNISFFICKVFDLYFRLWLFMLNTQ